MSISPDPLQLHALVDGELDLTRQLEIEASADPAVQAQLQRLRALRESVREHAEAHRAPDALRRRVTAMLAGEAAPRPRRRIAWPSFAAGAASLAVALAAVQWTLLPAQHVRRIEEQVLASHARAVVAERLVDVASSEHHVVKPWLSARLDFSPPVAAPPGSQLLGARVDYIDGRPVAVLVLQHAGHTVECYVWPTREGDAGVAWAQARGFQAARWTAAGMEYWVLSDLNPQELTALVRALRAGA